MASRQEEKEARRREREQAEQAAARAAARRKRIGILTGTVLGLALIAAVVVALTTAGDGDGADGPQAASASNVKVPTAGLEDLKAAAERANCELRTFPSEGRDHVREVQLSTYKTNPPTSGPHTPLAAEDGVYAPGNPPELGPSVHALEHGRINFQYKPGTPQQRIQQLEALFNQEVNGVPGYHSLLFENQTDMEAAVAATAWTQSLTCAEFSPAAFDALAAFRQRYVDKGPEFIP